MPWVKLDDLFPTNKKVMLAGRDARALYITALCHSANQLTDGFIDTGLVQLLGAISQIDDPQASAQKLVEVSLWEQAEGGYLIHDYHEYNPTRNEVMETREARAEAGFVGGVNSGEARRKAKRKQNQSKKDDETESKPNPVPVPVPVPGSENAGGKSRPKDLLFNAIQEACGVDPKTAGASIGKVKRSLSGAEPPYTPDEVRAFRVWWDSDEWRKKKGPPSLWKLQEQIGIVRSEKADINAKGNSRSNIEYSQADLAAAAEVTRRNRERLAAAAVPAV